MGAGKTTVGQELARQLNWRFDDLDDLIEAAAGTRIGQIFKQSGENAFREVECSILASTLAGGDLPRVLALGGGAFLDAGNQLRLRSKDIATVFLDAPVEELFTRSDQPDVVRPLRSDRDQFYRLYEQRRPEYLKAAFCVQTSGREIGSIAEEIIETLKLKRGVLD